MIKITLINIVLKKVYNYPVATFSYLLIPAACVMVDKKCTVLWYIPLSQIDWKPSTVLLTSSSPCYRPCVDRSYVDVPTRSLVQQFPEYLPQIKTALDGSSTDSRPALRTLLPLAGVIERPSNCVGTVDEYRIPVFGKYRILPVSNTIWNFRIVLVVTYTGILPSRGRFRS